MKKPIRRLAAELHNCVQDLTYFLEHNEEGQFQRVPEHVRDTLNSLYKKTSQLTEVIEEQV